MNYELQPGDTATVAQEDGEVLTIRAYDHFTMIQAASVGTTLRTDQDSHFIMSVKVVDKSERKVRATDDVVEFMQSRFPDRVGTARIMDFNGTAILGVKIDIKGLTHSSLIHAGMSYDEAVHLLGK